MCFVRIAIVGGRGLMKAPAWDDREASLTPVAQPLGRAGRGWTTRVDDCGATGRSSQVIRQSQRGRGSPSYEPVTGVAGGALSGLRVSQAVPRLARRTAGLDPAFNLVATPALRTGDAQGAGD